MTSVCVSLPSATAREFFALRRHVSCSSAALLRTLVHNSLPRVSPVQVAEFNAELRSSGTTLPHQVTVSLPSPMLGDLDMLVTLSGTSRAAVLRYVVTVALYRLREHTDVY